MAAPHSTEHYTRTAVLLHWLVAILALGLLALGAVMVHLPMQTPLRGSLFDLHKSVGVLVLLLMLFRVGWRLFHAPPSLRRLTSFHRYTARTVHGVLYAFLLVQPLTGYLSSAFGLYGVSFFGVPVAPFAHPEPQARQILIAMHHLGAWLLSGLLLLHVCAATWHRFWGDRTIAARMWFRGAVRRADR